MSIKTTLDNSLSGYAKNLRDIALQLNYDKGSPNAKVSISQFEFVKEEAKLLLEKAKGAGLGIGFGVPYKIELEDKGNYETILDGIVDLMNHEKLSCREVIAPVIEKGGNDFLTETADSFTFDFLFSRRPDLLDKTKFKYLPYVKNRPDNGELATAIFSLISLIIQIEQGIEALIGSIAELAAFSWEKLVRVIVLAVYVFFLLNAAIQLTQAILDMILAPVKYHACMSALELCQIGAEYKGYTFSSTILEGDFKNLVIVPPKNQSVQNEENDFVTGFTQPKPDEQVGYYQGTFGQLLRDLIVMFNGKIIIEEPLTAGGKKQIRLEREDYNNSQELYSMPDVDFDGVFRYNTDEFNAARSLNYLTDSQDINTFQFFQNSNILEVVEPIDNAAASEYCNLYKGYEETTIPFSLAVRKDDSYTRSEEIIIDILSILQPLIEEMVFVFNVQTVRKYREFGDALNVINTILATFGVSPITNPFPDIEEIIITVPDFSAYTANREGVMLLETDYLSTHRVALLEEGFTVTLTESNRAQLGQFALDNDFPFATTELVDLLSGIESVGQVYQNTLSEDNNFKLSALNIYEEFHIIKSFLPSTDRPLGNQWQIIEVENVPFCKQDFDLLKTDNYFKNAQGETCLLESAEWFPFYNKANLKYRINKQYFTNIQLKNNEYVKTNGR